jgi:hypothetical protein
MERRTTTRRTVSAAAAVARNSAASALSAASSAKMKFMFGAIDLNDEKNADLVIARHLWQDHRLLPPQSKGRERWEKILILLMLYTSFVIPLRAAFGGMDDTALTTVEVIIDACYLLDIIVNFRTAVVTRDYELVFEPKAIAHRYISS